MIRIAPMLGLLVLMAMIVPARADKLESASFEASCVSIDHPIPLTTLVRAGADVVVRPCAKWALVLEWDQAVFGDRIYLRSHAQEDGLDLCIGYPGDTMKEGVGLKIERCDQTLGQLWTRTIQDDQGKAVFTAALSGKTAFCLAVSNNTPGVPKVVARACDAGDPDQVFILKQ